MKVTLECEVSTPDDYKRLMAAIDALGSEAIQRSSGDVPAPPVATPSSAGTGKTSRTKPKKSDELPAVPTSPESTPPPAPAPPAEAASTVAAPAAGIEQVRLALASVTQAPKKGLVAATELLSRFQAKKISDIKVADYPAFIKACNETVAEAAVLT